MRWSPTGKPVVPQKHTHLRQGFGGSSAGERNPPKPNRSMADRVSMHSYAFPHGQGRGLLRRRINRPYVRQELETLCGRGEQSICAIYIIPDNTAFHFSIVFALSSGLIRAIGYQSSFQERSRHASITTLAAVRGFPFSVDLFSCGGIAV